LDNNGTAALQAGLGTFKVDLTPPTVTATLLNLNTSALGLTSYSFTLTFTDVSGIDPTTVAGEKVEVTGTAGYDQFATLTGTSASSNGQSITATYTISAPGGSWDVADGGIYSVAASSAAIKDTFGNAYAGGTIGSFVANFGNALPLTTGTISGTVYNDANGNGKLDPRELPMVGVLVYADLNQNGKFDPGEPSATTDASGHYTLLSLSAGQYIVREQTPAGYVPSISGGDSVTVNLANGQAATLVDFADQVNQVVISHGPAPISTPPPPIQPTPPPIKIRRLPILWA
jgi:hypothetical protein